MSKRSNSIILWAIAYGVVLILVLILTGCGKKTITITDDLECGQNFCAGQKTWCDRDSVAFHVWHCKTVVNEEELD